MVVAVVDMIVGGLDRTLVVLAVGLLQVVLVLPIQVAVAVAVLYLLAQEGVVLV